MWFINYLCSFSTIGCLSTCQYFSDFYYCNFWGLQTTSLFCLVCIRCVVVNIKFMKTVFKVTLVCPVSWLHHLETLGSEGTKLKSCKSQVLLKPQVSPWHHICANKQSCNFSSWTPLFSVWYVVLPVPGLQQNPPSRRQSL